MKKLIEKIKVFFAKIGVAFNKVMTFLKGEGMPMWLTMLTLFMFFFVGISKNENVEWIKFVYPATIMFVWLIKKGMK